MNPPLVCPRCRRVERGVLVWARLEEAVEGYGCPACFVTYPLDYEVEEIQDPLEWRVRAGARTVHVHHCQLLVARKR